MTPPADPPRRGRCTLVGAGPGDPELLTVKAVRAIEAATVLFVDDLVSEAVVALARPGARIVRVGKRGGCASTPQAFIERLIVYAVREGETVVRLKGGDPFVFGRGGEEVERLAAAGIDCDVVSGITAGLAAAAAIGAPWTHRDHAQGVVLVTGHPREGGAATDWAALGAAALRARLTLVVYMGVAGLDAIAAGLLRSLPGHTPAALVQHASLAGERRVVTTLARLAGDAAAQGIASPAVVIVGDVLSGVAAAARSDAAARYGS